MTRLLAAALGVGVLTGAALTGCGSQPNDSEHGSAFTTGDGAPTSSAAGGDPTATPEASIAAEVTREAGPTGDDAPEQIGLLVRYEVTNTGAEPLLVVAERGHAQSNRSSAPPVPEPAWVSAGADGAARVSKQVFDAPSGVLPTDPWSAPAQLVPPGADLDGAIVVTEPLRTDLPAVRQTLTHDEQPLHGALSTMEVCIQVAPSTGEESDNNRVTMNTFDRSLVCTTVDIPGLDGG